LFIERKYNAKTVKIKGKGEKIIKATREKGYSI
jgi:hypothetical protein